MSSARRQAHAISPAQADAHGLTSSARTDNDSDDGGDGGSGNFRRSSDAYLLSDTELHALIPQERSRLISPKSPTTGILKGVARDGTNAPAKRPAGGASTSSFHTYEHTRSCRSLVVARVHDVPSTTFRATTV